MTDGGAPPNSTPNPAEIRRFVESLRSPDYWQALVPELTVEGRVPEPANSVTVDPQSVASLAPEFRREGYFQCDRLVPASLVERMRRGIERLTEARCPLAFAFIFDEFWQTFPGLSPLFERLLGSGYRQLPDFWVWRIDPAQEEAGWRPHRDKGFGSLLPDGSPRSLTVWVALTEATPLNGCIYVVPAHLDAPMPADNHDANMPRNLQDVRALPAPAGSVLGWNQALLHWGGRACRRAGEPRISFACEFQRGDQAPYNTPLLDPHRPPPFALRLGLIGKQILQYRHMHRLSDALAAAGELLSQGLARGDLRV